MHARQFLFAGLIGATCLMAASAHAAGVSTQDFVRTASIANKFEIESSKMALDKSQDSKVRQFAQDMIADHTKIGGRFKKAVKASKTTARPAQSLDSEHQALIDELKTVSDKDFDRRYIDIQTDAHKQAVTLFSGYAQHGRNATLRNFAGRTLPMLKQHLAHVRQLHAAQ